jgi:hypothetical protein
MGERQKVYGWRGEKEEQIRTKTFHGRNTGVPVNISRILLKYGHFSYDGVNDQHMFTKQRKGQVHMRMTEQNAGGGIP